MAGKNVLWVAKQHGHSTTTMLRAYAAWVEGAVEADVRVIDRSMNLTSRAAPVAKPMAPCRYGRRPLMRGESLGSEDLAADQSVATCSDEFCAIASSTDVASGGPATLCLPSESQMPTILAGVPGFEPGNGGIKSSEG